MEDGNQGDRVTRWQRTEGGQVTEDGGQSDEGCG